MWKKCLQWLKMNVLMVLTEVQCISDGPSEWLMTLIEEHGRAEDECADGGCAEMAAGLDRVN